MSDLGKDTFLILFVWGIVNSTTPRPSAALREATDPPDPTTAQGARLPKFPMNVFAHGFSCEET